MPDYNPTAAAAAASAAVIADLTNSTSQKVKRTTDVNAPCASQPDGYGPKPPQDTVESFLSYSVFKVCQFDSLTSPSLIRTQAASVNAPTPVGYSLTFQDFNASSSANSYLGLYTLKEYSTYKCQELCDGVDYCSAFNIYFERDPQVNPADACPNPPSFTNVKCTLWGSQLGPETATNKGQYRRDFHVVITGSNGIDRLFLHLPLFHN